VGDAERLHALLDAGPRFQTARLTVRHASESAVRAWLAGPRKRLEQGSCVDVWDGQFHWHANGALVFRLSADREDDVWTTGRQTLDTLLRPSDIRRTHAVEPLGAAEVAGRPVLRAHVRPRPWALYAALVAEAGEVPRPAAVARDDDVEEVIAAWDALPVLVLADEAEIAVDADHGVLLAVRTRYRGQEHDPLLVEEAVFDEPIPDERFVYVPPPGLEVSIFD
jgi:hypothetical protein